MQQAEQAEQVEKAPIVGLRTGRPRKSVYKLNVTTVLRWLHKMEPLPQREGHLSAYDQEQPDSIILPDQRAAVLLPEGVVLRAPHGSHMYRSGAGAHLPGFVRTSQGALRSCTEDEYALFLRGCRTSYSRSTSRGYMVCAWGPDLLPLVANIPALVAKLDAEVAPLDARVLGAAPVYIAQCVVHSNTYGEQLMYKHRIRTQTHKGWSLWAGPAYSLLVTLHGREIPILLVVDTDGNFVASELCHNATGLNHVQFHPAVNKASLYTWLAGPGEEKYGQTDHVMRLSTAGGADFALDELCQLAHAFCGADVARWPQYKTQRELRAAYAKERLSSRSPTVVVWYCHYSGCTMISQLRVGRKAERAVPLISPGSARKPRAVVYRGFYHTPDTITIDHSYGNYSTRSVSALIVSSPAVLGYFYYALNIREAAEKKRLADQVLLDQAQRVGPGGGIPNMDAEARA